MGRITDAPNIVPVFALKPSKTSFLLLGCNNMYKYLNYLFSNLRCSQLQVNLTEYLQFYQNKVLCFQHATYLFVQLLRCCCTL